jgi:chaperone modulatory protein CbpM
MADDLERQHLMATILEEESGLTLVQMSHACAVHTELIVSLVEEGVLEPRGRTPREWRFTGAEVHRAGVAIRLQRDLGINLPGVALVLDLLEELGALRQRSGI